MHRIYRYRDEEKESWQDFKSKNECRWDVYKRQVFDTAFHQSIPEQAFLYGLPYYYYKKYRIRRYGFHGTSHKYVAQKASEMLGQNINELKIISCHLGNGSSITAVKEGKSIDTSLSLIHI